MAPPSASDDVRMLQVILDAGGLPPALLSDSLAAAKKDGKTEIVAALEKAGAVMPVVATLTPAQLARYPGTYNDGRQEAVLSLKDGALIATVGGNQTLTLSPRSETSFAVESDSRAHRDVRDRGRAGHEPDGGEPDRRAGRLQASRRNEREHSRASAAAPVAASLALLPLPRRGRAAVAVVPWAPGVRRRRRDRARRDVVERARPATAVLWKTPIPGLAVSSPIVWGDRIFVSTAVSSDPNAELPARPLRRRRAGQGRQPARRGG